jgi:outer membrane immunogenic protein
MKALSIIAAASIVALSSAAYAADAVETIPSAPMAIEQPVVFSWAGTYAGIHGGYAWANAESGAFAGGDDDFDGGRIGGFVGHNWQFGNGFVAGLEGDVNYDWNENSYAGGIDADGGFSGSVRGRVGFAMDRALIFAAGGWTATNASVNGAINDDDTRRRRLRLHGQRLRPSRISLQRLWQRQPGRRRFRSRPARYQCRHRREVLTRIYRHGSGAIRTAPEPTAGTRVTLLSRLCSPSPT